MSCQTTWHQHAPSSGLFTGERAVTQLGASTSTPRILSVALLVASKLELPSARRQLLHPRELATQLVKYKPTRKGVPCF